MRIDHLCGRAGRTKGSFYHHFKSREDFVIALLSLWEQELTQAVITQVENKPTPVARLIALNKLTIDIGGGLERELRRWAGGEVLVEVAIDAVDQRRIKYVASLLMQAKNITPQKAIDLAVMTYTSLVGFQQMFSPISAERRQRIDHIYVDILTNLPDHT